MIKYYVVFGTGTNTTIEEVYLFKEGYIKCLDFDSGDFVGFTRNAFIILPVDTKMLIWECFSSAVIYAQTQMERGILVEKENAIQLFCQTINKIETFVLNFLKVEEIK